MAANAVRFLVFSFLLIAIFHSCESNKVCGGGPNDFYTECGSWCPITCEEPNPRPCILSCKMNTCECKAGYFRRSDGKCVTQRGCKVGPTKK